jgi:heme-degrading monooxygenase HmoA
MKLNIKHRFRATEIIDEKQDTLFIIKNKSFFSSDKNISTTDGTPVFSIKKDLNPLDHRDKYIFTEYSTQNEFYAWVDSNLFQAQKSRPFFKRLMSSPIEIYLEAESFFGELLIQRSGISKFDILLNGSKRGSITRKSIECGDIDDAGLLSVLYLLTNYIVGSEELLHAANAK